MTIQQDRAVLRTYRQTKNWSATARRHNISATMVKAAVKRASMAEWK